MRRALTILWRVAAALAWTLVVLGVALFALEESGVLARAIRARIVAELGAPAESIELKRVTLRWFEPALELEDLVLPDPDGGAPLVRLRRVQVRIRRDPLSGFSAGSIEVAGGRVVLSEALLDAARALAEAQAEEPEGEPGASPPLRVSSLDLAAETPFGAELELGRVDLLVEPDGDTVRLRGRYAPSLSGAIADGARIDFEGGPDAAGALRVRASSVGVQLDSGRLGAPFDENLLPVRRASGTLALEIDARVDLVDAADVDVVLRGELSGGRVQPASSAPPVEDIAGAVRVRFAPTEERWIWDADSWEIVSSLEAAWLGTELRAWAALGRAAPGDALARGFGRLPSMALSEETLETLGLLEHARRDWEALAPSGFADVSLDLELPAPAAPGPLDPEAMRVALHLRMDGRAGGAYRGWTSERRGTRDGFPVPIESIEGDLLYARTPHRPRRERLGLVDMRGAIGAGRIEWSGFVCSPLANEYPDGRARADVDVALRARGAPLDERVRVGLEGNAGTRGLYDLFRPAGGLVDADWRFRQGSELGGTTGVGSVRLTGASLAWRELPVPLVGVDGTIDVRWARESVPIRDSPNRMRPVGVAWDLRSDGELGAAARVSGFTREERRGAGPVDDPDDAYDRTFGLRVELDPLPLSGNDWERLVSAFPDVGERVDDLRARGSVRAVYRGGRPRQDLPRRSDTEVTATQLEMTPREFQRRTERVHGRVLVTSVDEDDDPSTDGETETRFALAGRWAPDVDVVAFGATGDDGAGRVVVFAGGIDPQNAGMRGALATAFASDEDGEPAIDLTEIALIGRLDYAGELSFEVGDDRPTDSRNRIFLRDDTLAAAHLRLDALHGVLEHHGDVLRADAIEARLADTPLSLRNVRVFRAEDAASIEGADPTLLPGGTLAGARGFALQADLVVDDLPLDERHLSRLFDPERLGLVRDSASWSGELDARGARLVLVPENEHGPALIAVRGLIVPQALSMRLGLPIEIDTADVDVRELVLEGGRLRGWAEIGALRASVAGRNVDDASMIVTYRDGRLTVDELAGNFEGGRIASLGGEALGGHALGIDLAPPHRFQMDVRLGDVAVDELLAGLFEAGVADRGRLSAALRMRGTPDRVRGLVGDGWIQLSDARLWSIPVMRELFSTLGFDRTAVFQEMRLRFRLLNGLIEFPELVVKSPLLQLSGDGSLDLDGALRCDLEVRYSLVDRLGPLNQLVYWLNDSLWRVAVRGDMARPQVLLRNSFLEVLSSFEDSPRRRLPLPSFERLPERF